MHRIEHTAHFWITLENGQRLAASLWRPLVQEPVPAILEYLPYRKRDGTAPRDATTHPVFASHGYACLRVDIMGSGESDGLFDDEYSERELAHGEEVIAWLARQDWCDGRIGMIGISWGGFNGLQLAFRRPPALKAVVSVCSSVDRFEDDIHFMGGCLLTDNFNWSAQMTAYMTRPPDPMLREDWRGQWLKRMDDLPLLAARWLQHPARDDYWRHGSVCEDFAAIEAPVLAIGGWADAYLNAPDAIARNLGAGGKALIGPWEHKYPHISRINAADFHGQVLGWFDAHLKGQGEALPALRAFIEEFDPPSPSPGPRSGRWIAESQWPSPHIREHTLKLSPGRLQAEPGIGTALIDSPCHTGQAAAYFCPGMRIDYELADDQSRDDALSVCFDSDSLDHFFELLGRPQVKLAFQADKTSARLAIRLCDVAPDGTSLRITYRCFNPSFHEDRENPVPLEPGKTYQMTFSLNMCGYRLEPGHRLRLAISTHYWPVIWPSPDKAAVSLDLEQCELILPVREAIQELDPQSPGQPIDFPRLEMASLREAVSDTQRFFDEEGRYVLTTFDDFGAQRLPDQGLEAASSVSQCFAIHPDDPLSAYHEAQWNFTFGRADWSVRIESVSTMTSSETEFLMTREIVGFEHGTECFRRSDRETVPRSFF